MEKDSSKNSPGISIDNIRVGRKIQSIRKERGLTQEELAERSNLSVNYISKIERTEEQNITLRSLLLVANALTIDMGEILLTAPSREMGGFYTNMLVDKLVELDPKIADNISKKILELIEEFKKIED